MNEHIHFDLTSDPVLTLLDQRELPTEKYIKLYTCDDVIGAIKNMAVRGAPAIGVTAAFGCVLAAHEAASHGDWRQFLEDYLVRLEQARPTAVNLAWAVNRMRGELDKADGEPLSLVKQWADLAWQIQREDIEICRALGRKGQIVIDDGDTVLTHCNAGSLATAGYGTALGVIRAAVEAGKKVRVIADETRPLLQGARLTAYELAKDGIPVTVACDDACASIMSRGLVQVVITGADRIAANGDTANKIGTMGVAILADYFNIPFYIAAPLSTVDLTLANGDAIPIEERSQQEVSQIGSFKSMPSNVPALNPAFDVTPHKLIKGILTEVGIVYPPYEKTLADAMKK